MKDIAPRITYAFAEFELDPLKRVLVKNGKNVTLNPKAFEVLCALVHGRGEILSKDYLLEAVWPGQFVEENNLTVHISALRKALGEKKGEHPFILTVPGRGYRFVADVAEENEATDVIIESRSVSRITIEESADHEVAPTIIPAQASPQTVRTISAAERPHRRYLPIVLASLLSVGLLLALGIVGYRFYQKRSQGQVPPPPLSFQNATLRRLTTSGKVTGAAISPDGKYLVYAQAEAEGQSLWIRQITESRSIPIIAADAVEYWGLTFSPDSTHMYGTVFTAKKADPELIRVAALGGPIERLPNVATSSIAFSPDGKRFAYFVSSSSSGGTLLRVADANGANDKVLAMLKNPSYFMFPGKTLAWSPDGATIACAAKIVDAAGDYGTVLSVRVSDGNTSPLTERRWPWTECISWLPDGSGLIVTANEDAASPLQTWHVSVPGGEAKKLSNDLSWYSWASLTADGQSLVVVQDTTTSTLWVADYDESISTAKQIASEIGDFGEIAWTPEGKVIYRSSASGKQNLWRMDADGSNQTQLTKDALPDKGLSVSSDGRYMVFSSFRGGKYNLWRAEANGGQFTQMTNGAGEVFPRITPDNRWIIFQKGTGQANSELWKMPLEGGAAELIMKQHCIFPALSPDGRFVACFYMDTAKSSQGQWRIGITNVDSGARDYDFEMPANIFSRVVRWTPDSQAIIYAKANGEVGNLWRQSLDGSAPAQLTRFDQEKIEQFALSNDGKRIAFTRSTKMSDVVLLQNFR